MDAISRWAHLEYLLLFSCRCGEPIRQLREWKEKLSPVHFKTQPSFFDDNLFHIVIVTYSSSSVQTHPTFGECSRNVQTQSFSPLACLAHSSDKKRPLRDRSPLDPANTCTPSRLCAHAQRCLFFTPFSFVNPASLSGASQDSALHNLAKVKSQPC